FTKEI
ncbi:hypothetical protein D046_8332, partial [Vibrio parahaemolyticus V-223/04]